MKITVDIKRAYEPAGPHDGYRVLVDRLWPRGIKKESLKLDLWCKELAPSSELRKWFGHSPDRWQPFAEQYQTELRNTAQTERIRTLIKEAASTHFTLVYGARDPHHNHALILADEITRVAKNLRHTAPDKPSFPPE